MIEHFNNRIFKETATTEIRTIRTEGTIVVADSIQKLLNRKGSAKQTSCIGRCWSEFCQIAIEFGEHRWKAPREVHSEEEEEDSLEEQSEGD